MTAAALRISTLVLVWLLQATLSSPAIAQEVYRYTDADGQTHFTDSVTAIPREYRDQVSRVEGLPAQDPAETRSGDGADSATETDAWALLGRAASEREGDAALLGGLGLGAWIAFVGLCAVVAIALSALVLMLACKLAGEAPIGFSKAVLVVVVMSVTSGIVVAPFSVVMGTPSGAASAVLWMLASFGAMLASNAGVLRGLHGESYGRCLWASVLYVLLPMLIAVPIGVVLGVLAALFR